MKKKRKAKNWSLDVWTVARLYILDHGSESLLPVHVSYINGLIRARDIVRLATIADVIGFCYSEPYPNRVLAQLSAFFKKNKDFSDEEKCFNAAFASFKEAESMCTTTNDRLVSFFNRESRITDCWEVDLLSDIRKMRHHISKLCGPLKGFLSTVKGRKVTSGATSSLPRRISQPYRKVRKKACGTSGSIRLFKLFQKSLGMRSWDTTVVKANRISLVSKSYKIHRVTASEPEINMLFQTQVDYFLKKRLHRWGIDLKDQFRNKEYARLGSIDGSIATIDLSMASDTMARELIPFLFDDEWSYYLNLLRCPEYSGPFGEGNYAKFSSQGNGITFALETVIFAAAMKVTGSKTVSVYGDDIIIDSDRYQRAVFLLNFLGFIPNEEKSFHEGPFRESCGGDFFRGEDIRPFYIKKSSKLPKTDLCHIVNGLSSVAGKELGSYLKRLIKLSRLPLVPHSENSRQGVHVDIQTAYRLGLIKTNANKLEWMPCYWGYVEKSVIKRRSNVKTYLLWLLHKETHPNSHHTSSMVESRSIVRYGQIRWQIPIETPIHLFWWSDFIVQANASTVKVKFERGKRSSLTI